VVTRRELVWTAAVATVAAGAGAGALLGASRPASGDGPEPAAAKRFLTRYVTADGQVVRRDQGGDTVSEGQAYAMLLTATSGDRDRFRRPAAQKPREPHRRPHRRHGRRRRR
jgi:endoglucanase